MSFDIQLLERSKESTFDVIVGHLPGPKDSDGKDTLGAPVGFRIVGPASDRYAAAERDVQVLNIKETHGRKKMIDLETDEGARVVVDGGPQRRDMIVMACTVGWFGFTENGEEAPFTSENLARVLKARPHWSKRLIGAIENEGNFDAA